MLISFLILISSSTLLIWWMHPADTFPVYMVVLGIGALLYYWEAHKQTRHSEKGKDSVAQGGNKVVYLDEIRRRKQREEKKNQDKSDEPWVSIFESHFIVEADLVAAMLENHGILTQILNRQNATILIHPMGALTVKVLVSRDDATPAIRLIEKHRNSSQPPEKPSA
ncbi:DUF2007 domain-containing protein [Deltaproteobacteria bacterium TL4]